MSAPKQIHPTAQQGFGHKEYAQKYENARPNYPESITPWLQQHLQLTPKSQLLDLAAGTGKFTHYLLPITQHITALEPVEEMRNIFKQHYPKIHLVDGVSNKMPLTNGQFDTVVCAQAFHWFSNLETLNEIHRVLKPNGDLILIWNYRDESIEWVQQLSACLSPFEKDTPRFHTRQWQDVFSQQNKFITMAEQQLSYQHQGSVEQVVTERLLSSSFIRILPKNQQLELRHQIESIIQNHLNKTANDQINFPYITYIYHFKSSHSESS